MEKLLSSMVTHNIKNLKELNNHEEIVNNYYQKETQLVLTKLPEQFKPNEQLQKLLFLEQYYTGWLTNSKLFLYILLEKLDNKFISNYLFFLINNNKSLNEYETLFNDLAGSKTNKQDKKFDSTKLKEEVKVLTHALYKYLLLLNKAAEANHKFAQQLNLLLALESTEQLQLDICTLNEQAWVQNFTNAVNALEPVLDKLQLQLLNKDSKDYDTLETDNGVYLYSFEYLVCQELQTILADAYVAPVVKDNENQSEKESEKEIEKDNKDSKDKKKKEKPKKVQIAVIFKEILNFYTLKCNPNYYDFKLDFLYLNRADWTSEVNDSLVNKNQMGRIPKQAKGTRDYTADQCKIRDYCFDLIKSEFQKHGAVCIDTPVFELKEVLTSKYGEDSKLIYDLQDQGGEKLSLRYDLTVPFARYLATNNVSSIKRYHFGKVYRRDQPNMKSGRFREFWQCDFDIAGQYENMVADAEVVKIISSILKNLQIGKFVVKLNHRKLLEAMMEASGCDLRKFKTICSSIDKLDKEPWEVVSKELIQKEVNELSVNELEQYVKLKGKPSEMVVLLKETNLYKLDSGKASISELEVLSCNLQAFECEDSCLIDLSLARGLDYYTGMIMEAVLINEDGSVSSSVAGGGRYDYLVGMFSSKNIPSVGASVGIERIMALMSDKFTGNYDQLKVFVACIGEYDRERLELVNLLWSNGITAETMYKLNNKPKKQFEKAHDWKCDLVLIIGEDELQDGLVKVKYMKNSRQFNVPRDQLVDWLHNKVYENETVQGEIKNQEKDDEKKI